MIKTSLFLLILFLNINLYAEDCSFFISKPSIAYKSELLQYRKEIEDSFHLPAHFIEEYYARRILPYLAKPSYTPTDNEFLYRGLYLSIDDIANIMTNGFELKFNSWAVAGGKGVYFSSSEREASDYIFQACDFKKTKPIGVVFKVKKRDYMTLVNDPVYNSTNTIFVASNMDVPKEDIVDIMIKGEFGLESLSTIIQRAKDNKMPSNAWVDQFSKRVIYR